MLKLKKKSVAKRLKIKIYRIIILPVILYGYETWLLTMREERRLGMFENSVLRRIFGRKREKVTREWRKLHKEELNNLYSSPHIVQVIKSRRMRWLGHVVHMGKKRGIYRILVGKPEQKRLLRRPRHRGVNNIKLELQEGGCGGTDWIELAQCRDTWRGLVDALINLHVP